MKIDEAIKIFLDYLLIEKGLAKNTIDSYCNDLSEFRQFVVLKKKIDNVILINKQVILDYYSLLELKGLSNSTLQRRYSSVNQMFIFLIKRKIIIENPMITMRRHKKELKLPKFLTEEEMEKLLNVNKPKESLIKLRNRLIIEMLYSTGMRVSELCSLNLKSLLFDKKAVRDYKFITIIGKGQKERIVPLKASIIPLLNDYILLATKKEQKYLFYSNSKEHHITRRTIENILKNTAVLANIDPKKVSPHKIRHSFATHLLQKGLDIREIQELLGHSSIDTTEIYTKVNNKELNTIINNFF